MDRRDVRLSQRSQPEGKGRDRIVICEDTDGDGRADKFTVFAEKLSIPTSLTFYRGGVIVHAGAETIFLKDTDGDDKADVRNVLFSGWSTGDTHGGPSNLQYGLDNWIWGMQGYTGFDGDGRRRRASISARASIRFKPRRLEARVPPLAPTTTPGASASAKRA